MIFLYRQTLGKYTCGMGAGSKGDCLCRGPGELTTLTPLTLKGSSHPNVDKQLPSSHSKCHQDLGKLEAGEYDVVMRVKTTMQHLKNRFVIQEAI